MHTCNRGLCTCSHRYMAGKIDTVECPGDDFLPQGVARSIADSTWEQIAAWEFQSQTWIHWLMCKIHALDSWILTMKSVR